MINSYDISRSIHIYGYNNEYVHLRQHDKRTSHCALNEVGVPLEAGADDG
jgi:hypothetical protein